MVRGDAVARASARSSIPVHADGPRGLRIRHVGWIASGAWPAHGFVARLLGGEVNPVLASTARAGPGSPERAAGERGARRGFRASSSPGTQDVVARLATRAVRGGSGGSPAETDFNQALTRGGARPRRALDRGGFTGSRAGPSRDRRVGAARARLRRQYRSAEFYWHASHGTPSGGARTTYADLARIGG